MTRVLVLGGGGMLGHKLWQRFQQHFDTWVTIRRTRASYDLLGLSDRTRVSEQFDATDANALETLLVCCRPDVVVNAVGVVKQAVPASDPETVVTTNSLLPLRLARMCAASDARLIHISTDCVFSGRTGMYCEQDVADADDLYGRSKLLGEIEGPRCLTLRTSMIGREILASRGLLEWFLGHRGGEVHGFRNVVFSGISTLELSDTLTSVIEDHAQLSGLYHVASDPIDKCTLLELLNCAYGTQTTVAPEDSPRIDRSLDDRRFRAETGIPRPIWRSMVEGLTADQTPYHQLRMPSGS